MHSGGIGRLFIVAGVIFIAFGLLLTLSGKMPWLGRLPGDIIIRRKNFTIYFPIVTSAALSVLLSLIFWLISRKR